LNLRICPLGSGSKGNAAVVTDGNTYILVDNGLNFRDIVQRMAGCEILPSVIDAILVTHEHSDHIRGIGLFVSNMGCPVYAHTLIADTVMGKCELTAGDVIAISDMPFMLGDILVTPFRVPHDAVYTLGYNFDLHGQRISIVTDIGIMTQGVYKNICDSDIVMIECNHDVGMLHNSSYPYPLKKRILSNGGHLCNEDSARTIAALGVRLQHVILAHLSEENNNPELALEAVKKALGCREVSVSIAYQDMAHGFIGIGGKVYA